MVVADDPGTLLDRFASWQAPAVERWIDSGST
jgi:hypothetical protein